MPTGILLRRAQRVHTALWNELFGSELTGPQYAALIAVARWPGSGQQAIGEITGHDKATMAGIVERLEKRGFVERKPDPGDLRRNMLDLTELGRGSMAGFAEKATAVHQALLGLLPTGAESEFVDLVRAVAYAGGEPATPRVIDPGFPVMSMTTTIGHLLRRAHQNHAARWNEAFGGQITIPQYCVLAAGCALEVPDQQTVSELAGLDASSAGVVVSRMEMDGWLIKTADQQDRRRKIIVITPAGRVAERWASLEAQQVEDRLLSALDVSERLRLAQLARHLIDAHEAGISPQKQAPQKQAQTSAPGLRVGAQ